MSSLHHYIGRENSESASSIRDINYVKILNLIRSERRISRAELARRLGLSRTTVTAVTRHLLSENIVVETGKGEAKSGRKPLVLELNRTAKKCIGIEISDEACVGVITDLYAEPVSEAISFPIETGDDPGEWHGARALKETFRTLRGLAGEDELFGAGIAIPGIYDARQKRIRVAESLELADFPIEQISRTLPTSVPIQLINRSNAAALGERWYGYGREVDNLLFVSINEGIGLGVIMNDELLLGATGSVGEIGHIRIVENGPLCRCGSVGCLESLVSRKVLIARAWEGVRSLGLENPTNGADIDPRKDVRWILRLAKEGNAYMQKLLEQQAEFIGMALAAVVNILDPGLIIIGGDLGIVLGTFFLPVIRSVVESRAQYFKGVEIAVSSLGSLAAPIGAAAYLLA